MNFGKRLCRILTALVLSGSYGMATADIASDTNTLLDWAEETYPGIFTSRETTQHFPPWLFRFYPETGIYAGIHTEENNVYVLGGPWGNERPTFIDSTPNLISRADPVSITLARLNVDTTPSPRVDASDRPLPDNYTPLGKSRTLAKKSEIFLAGLGLDSNEDNVNLLKFQPGISNTPGVANQPDSTLKLPPTTLDRTWKNSPHNHAAACDIDGDGLEEIVLFWWNSGNNTINLKVIDDEEESFAESQTSVLGTVASPSLLKVACGDFSGDGTDELVIAIVNDSARMITLDFLSGSKNDFYHIDDTFRKVFNASQQSSRLGIELATGQLDYDAGQEMGVVINETWGSGRNASPGTGRSDYYIYDDRGNSFIIMSTGRVAADVENNTHNGLTASIAMGDIDGDGLDETVLAALTGSYPVACEPIHIVQFALDHAVNNFANLGAHFANVRRNDQGSGCEQGGNNGHIEHIWVNTLDIDGDQYHEIQVNGEIYEDFFHANQPWTPLMVDTGGANLVPARIPNAYIYKRSGGNNDWARVTRDNTTITVGNVTADDKDNILVFSSGRVPVATGTNSNSSFLLYDDAVTVWGFDPLTRRWGRSDLPGSGSRGHIGLLYAERLAPNQIPASGPPIVLAANMDTDSTQLKFEEGSHQVVFSEPIVHAALAAPPCYNDGSQVSGDCRTSWGSGTSAGANASLSHEISVKHHIGAKGTVSLPFIGEFGVEAEKTVGVSLKAEASLGYELTRTVTFTTGPIEDTVVATVIPYDQYTYKIVSHPVFPQLTGQDMIVSLPRTPRTMQINRQFYNNSIVGDGVRIDGNVFMHDIGNPRSYPTRSQMQAQSGRISIGPQDVGASGGNQSVAISENLAAGFTTTIGISTEKTVKATQGKFMQGFTIGSTTEASLGFSVGSQVTFTGTVGDMPPATFSLDKAYSFGMYVYKLNPPNQEQFQVINYWVE
jgi:hypothetical protein